MHDGKDLYSLRDKNGKSILTASRQPGAKEFDELKTKFNKDDLLQHDEDYGSVIKKLLHRGSEATPNPYLIHALTLKKQLGISMSPHEEWLLNGQNK